MNRLYLLSDICFHILQQFLLCWFYYKLFIRGAIYSRRFLHYSVGSRPRIVTEYFNLMRSVARCLYKMVSGTFHWLCGQNGDNSAGNQKVIGLPTNQTTASDTSLSSSPKSGLNSKCSPRPFSVPIRNIDSTASPESLKRNFKASEQSPMPTRSSQHLSKHTSEQHVTGQSMHKSLSEQQHVMQSKASNLIPKNDLEQPLIQSRLPDPVLKPLAEQRIIQHESSQSKTQVSTTKQAEVQSQPLQCESNTSFLKNKQVLSQHCKQEPLLVEQNIQSFNKSKINETDTVKSFPQVSSVHHENACKIRLFEQFLSKYSETPVSSQYHELEPLLPEQCIQAFNRSEHEIKDVTTVTFPQVSLAHHENTSQLRLIEPFPLKRSETSVSLHHEREPLQHTLSKQHIQSFNEHERRINDDNVVKSLSQISSGDLKDSYKSRISEQFLSRCSETPVQSQNYEHEPLLPEQRIQSFDRCERIANDANVVKSVPQVSSVHHENALESRSSQEFLPKFSHGHEFFSERPIHGFHDHEPIVKNTNIATPSSLESTIYHHASESTIEKRAKTPKLHINAPCPIPDDEVYSKRFGFSMNSTSVSTQTHFERKETVTEDSNFQGATPKDSPVDTTASNEQTTNAGVDMDSTIKRHLKNVLTIVPDYSETTESFPKPSAKKNKRLIKRTKERQHSMHVSKTSFAVCGLRNSETSVGSAESTEDSIFSAMSEHRGSFLPAAGDRLKTIKNRKRKRDLDLTKSEVNKVQNIETKKNESAEGSHAKRLIVEENTPNFTYRTRNSKQTKNK